jgi:stage V sporulation protein R
MNKFLAEKLVEIEHITKEMGLDPYPINYEVVPQEVMLEVISYGLPTRARHWSYGQAYDYQKMQGEMGFSKIYEVVLNNNPSYAFLLDTNSDIANTMVCAHVVGHVHFFKHNYMFKKTDNKMVYHAAERAQRIEEYIEKYGINAVERVMDMGFAMDKAIDWHKGVSRKRYNGPTRALKETGFDEYDDVLGDGDLSHREVTRNAGFPPHPEYDLLWFLTEYAPMESWQRDIFAIIREESYYFYPQYMTKIMNEGFASFIHAEMMLNIPSLSGKDYIDFCKIHERVVQPGANKLNINPYFLGFSILGDVKKRWDKKFENDESEINGMEKIYEIIDTENDISFVRNYLTKELAEDLQLFAYRKLKNRSGDEVIKVTSLDLEEIVESIVGDLYNYRAPSICVTRASQAGLELEHHSIEIGTLDEKHLEKVMEYLYEIWSSPVNLKTIDENGEDIHYTYDELGFSG